MALARSNGDLRTSALILPTQTLDKTEHVIPDAEFVKLRRLMAFARTHGMIAMYFCQRCEQPVQLTRETPVQLTDERGPAAPVMKLECGCSRWWVR